ncbi:hypothetical protein EV127DRAFT_8413 [Xylaria flabelliformis]|nr:hypothetical protein EV127DRAFT_8413 [Xylaria flabelliformis]
MRIPQRCIVLAYELLVWVGQCVGCRIIEPIALRVEGSCAHYSMWPLKDCVWKKLDITSIFVVIAQCYTTRRLHGSFENVPLKLPR